MKRVVGRRIGLMWPKDSFQPAQLDPSGAETAEVEAVADRIRGLTPRDDSLRSLQSRALDLIEALLKTRWMVSAGRVTSVPLLFLVILLFWLAITFASFGLLAPRNTTVFVVLFVCALSVSSAIFLILEMDGPFDGLLRVSSDPLVYAYAHLNQ